MNGNGNFSFEDALESFGESLKRDICCCKVARIEKFYPDSKTVDVTIVLREKISEGHIIDNPMVVNVPLLGNRITLPVEPGEYCLVFFNDFDRDLWYTTGFAGEPATTRKHDIADAFAILGVNGLFNRLENYDNANISLNGNTRIDGDLDVTKNITINLSVTIQGETEFRDRVTLPSDAPNGFCCLPNCLFSGALHTAGTTG